MNDIHLLKELKKDIQDSIRKSLASMSRDEHKKLSWFQAAKSYKSIQ